VAQIRIDLPDADDRLAYLQSSTIQGLTQKKSIKEWSDFPIQDLSIRCAGLNLLRVHHLISEAIHNGSRVTFEHLSAAKKRLIEEYCQGLVRFKDPKPGFNLERVATHRAAKARLLELAWLIKNNKREVFERGILLPGRGGVGKSFLVDCFASDCGLPVMEIGEFRSKWVGDTERQQARILMTIRALGPVIVVVDEADAVFGTRQSDGDSGVSGRIFASFAAHIGDSSLRGRELWIAMTSRPDLLAIDIKRQGRFGLCIPLFAAQGADDIVDLFQTIGKVRKIGWDDKIIDYIRSQLGERALTGSDVEAIVVRACERATLAERDQEIRIDDLREAIDSFIDPLDPQLIALQELAAVLACSDARYLPPSYKAVDRSLLAQRFAEVRGRLSR
jgi:AAA+ superfamily predicted ATPase